MPSFQQKAEQKIRKKYECAGKAQKASVLIPVANPNAKRRRSREAEKVEAGKQMEQKVPKKQTQQKP